MLCDSAKNKKNYLVMVLFSKICQKSVSFLTVSFIIPSRLCLLPKGLAIAQLFEVSTCIVVDSGALTTSVWVVIDGKVDETKTQTMNIGGWHVSQFLKQALTW